MAASNAADGTQTATLATDHTVATVTAPTGGATYTAYVDASALVGAEVLEVTWLSRARVGDPLQVKHKETVASTSLVKLIDCPAIACGAGNDVRLILRQENGTGRAFPWAVRRVDG